MKDILMVLCQGMCSMLMYVGIMIMFIVIGVSSLYHINELVPENAVYNPIFIVAIILGAGSIATCVVSSFFRSTKN